MESHTPNGHPGGETVAVRLARWVQRLEFADIPPQSVAMARRCLLDQLGVQLRGATLPQVQPVFALVRAMEARPEATVINHGLRTTAAYAAYANGTFGHSCEFDDSHYHAGHPGVCVIPVALALAERDNLSGRELVTSIVAGYQAMVVSCGPIHRATLDLGWHGTKVAGVFGAAAAAARALRLDVGQTTNALAIAGSDASGTMEYDQSGGEVKRLHAGAPARSGMEAAILASHGFTGPHTIFEGKRGIYRLFGDGSEPDIERFWQPHWHIDDTIFKLYPAVGTVHSALDGFRELQARHGFAASDIDGIEVGLAPFAIPHGAAITRPHDVIGAQFSLAFSLGLRAVTGGSALQHYLDPAMWTDPEVLAVADRVRPVPIAIPRGEPELGASVAVTLRDGRTCRTHVRAFRGHPQNPATQADIEAKFRELATGILPPAQVEGVIEAVAHVDESVSVAPLLALLAPQGR